MSMMRSEEALGSFRTYHTARRVPAVPLQPVVDPAGWSPGDLGPVASWSYRITERDTAELSDAVAAVRRNGIPTEEVTREDFPLKALAGVLEDVRRELIDGRGIVMLQNFPIEGFDRQAQAIAYLGIGTYIGLTVSQNRQGHILGHVKDLGGDYADLNTRGYMTRAA